MNLLLFILLPAASFYLLSRATITHFIWSRYPTWLGKLRDCAACSGFWDTLLLALFMKSVHQDLPIYPESSFAPILLGLCGVIWTPLVAALQHKALETLGTVFADETSEATTEEQP
jgi:hypothetical protein